MFENLISTIKYKTVSLTDNAKSKSKKLSSSLSLFKQNMIGSDRKTSSFIVKNKRNDGEYFDNDFLAPRACSVNSNLQWPSVNDNMEWVPFVPPSVDEQNILDRFIRVITINDDCNNRRTDREEIRKRLAMGSEDDHYNDRPGRKPSLQARLQSGMNLQICFMNETVSDGESPNSDTESPVTSNPKSKPSRSKTRLAEKCSNPVRPDSLAIGQSLQQRVPQPMTESDFFAKQGRLQTEARMALAQAKEMARMQMEIERQRQEQSPIAEMVRHSLEKVGIPFPQDRRRLSRQILTEMNVAQLQVIVNDLHSQIETLNENLVKFLMHRDDLHMEQDSMLVDIEDLTRYLGAKEQSFKEQNQSTIQNNNIPPSTSPAPSSLSLPSFNSSSMKTHLHSMGTLLRN